ncbi:MAG: hypothetical protein KZQ63_00320, partial [Candidatus Thiodiazotropha sp. (ex Lucinoma aequizonata)]|nr:hypothetical protein [Candidatus Thiodiazotropha sp. (ex Lucinoma aequizonata)]
MKETTPHPYHFYIKNGCANTERREHCIFQYNVKGNYSAALYLRLLNSHLIGFLALAKERVRLLPFGWHPGTQLLGAHLNSYQICNYSAKKLEKVLDKVFLYFFRFQRRLPT